MLTLDACRRACRVRLRKGNMLSLAIPPELIPLARSANSIDPAHAQRSNRTTQQFSERVVVQQYLPNRHPIQGGPRLDLHGNGAPPRAPLRCPCRYLVATSRLLPHREERPERQQLQLPTRSSRSASAPSRFSTPSLDQCSFHAARLPRNPASTEPATKNCCRGPRLIHRGVTQLHGGNVCVP